MFPSITNEEREALHNLGEDDICMIHDGDKGVILFIIDKDMYIEKYMALLND